MIKVLEDWLLQRPLSLARNSHHLAVSSLLWACSPSVSSSSHKGINPIGLESHPDNLMQLYLLKGPSYNTVTLGVRATTWILGTQFHP